MSTKSRKLSPRLKSTTNSDKTTTRTTTRTTTGILNNNFSNKADATCSTAPISKRTKYDLPLRLRNIIDIITVNAETLPVGTFKYKMFKYPGDVDLFEKIESCCSWNTSKINSALVLQDIVRNINNNPDIIFKDFKAGYDDRFKVYTGNIVNDHVDDYIASYIRRDITNLYEAQLLNAARYSYLLSLVKDQPSIMDVITLNEELRKHWLIRWNAQEIIAGYKLLAGNYKLYFDIALTQGSIVKLDIVSMIDDRYVEISNFYVILQRDRYGNVKFLSEELSDYGRSLIEDVYKYYDTNTLKSIKRLWMYLAFENRLCDLKLFKDLFSGDIALYSQIVADIEVAIDLLSSNIKTYDQAFLFSSLNQRINLLDGLCTNQMIYEAPTDAKAIMRNFVKLKDCLISYINTKTNEWLQQRQIYPLKMVSVLDPNEPVDQ